MRFQIAYVNYRFHGALMAIQIGVNLVPRVPLLSQSLERPWKRGWIGTCIAQAQAMSAGDVKVAFVLKSCALCSRYCTTF